MVADSNFVPGNSGIKVFGFNDYKGHYIMAENMGILGAELKILRKYQSYAADLSFLTLGFQTTSSVESFEY